MKELGVIKKIGLSIYSNYEFEHAINNEFVDVIQLPYNLLDNRNQRGLLLNKAKIFGKEIQARSIFLQGLFFKNLPIKEEKISALNPYLFKLKYFTEKYDISMLRMAINYVLNQKDVDYLVLGIDGLDQLDQIFNNLDYKLSCELMDAIDSLSVIEVEKLYPKNWN